MEPAPVMVCAYKAPTCMHKRRAAKTTDSDFFILSIWECANAGQGRKLESIANGDCAVNANDKMPLKSSMPGK